MYDYKELDERNMKGTFRDWRQALRSPLTFRVGNAVRIQPQSLYFFLLIGGLLLMLFYYNWWTSNQSAVAHKWINNIKQYNKTYPLTAPFLEGDIITFRIGIIGDLDTNSKSAKPDTFESYYKKGFLSYHKVKKYVTVTWDNQPPVKLTSSYSYKGRGMELSELIVYDGRLLTFDDRSGMIFEIQNNKIIPWVVLAHGNGNTENGFKTEWATIKDEILYVGSMGKEWTTSSGEFENEDPMWVKALNNQGQVQHINWVNQYKALRSSIGIKWPGYMIHEAAAWSPIRNEWFFLPRKCSFEPYNETKDEIMGCNYILTADADFRKVHALEMKRDPKLGFSSFKFIPGTNEEAIVALKTMEFEGKTSTTIIAFNIEGKVLMQDAFVENIKYEGIEFV